jgi:hypothetical protein
MCFSDEEDSNFTQFLNEISGTGQTTSERKDFLKFDFFRSKSTNQYKEPNHKEEIGDSEAHTSDFCL